MRRLDLSKGLVVWIAVAWIGCGGGDERAEPATTPDTAGDEAQAEEPSGAVVCEQAVRCCYAFVSALTENRPEDRSTCIDLEQFPTRGSAAARTCSEMIFGWHQALVEANRDAPACS